MGIDVEIQLGSRGGFAALGRRMGVHRATVSYWFRTGKFPPERVPEIERLTGISREEMRPDLWPAPAPQQEPAG